MMSWMASEVVPWPPMSGVWICRDKQGTEFSLCTTHTQAPISRPMGVPHVFVIHGCQDSLADRLGIGVQPRERASFS